MPCGSSAITLSVRSNQSIHDAGAEAQVLQNRAVELSLERFEQAAFMETGQFLHQCAAADFDFEHATFDRTHARAPGNFLARHFGPGLLEAESLLLSPPAAGDEQLAQDFRQPFGASVHDSSPLWLN